MMRSVAPLTPTDITIDERSYVRCVLTQIWQELPLLTGGALLFALACLPSLLLLVLGRPGLAALAALFGAVPAWAAYCYLVSCVAAARSTSLADMARAFAALYRRSSLLSIPALGLLYLLQVTQAAASRGVGTGTVSLLLVASATAQFLILFVVCLGTLHALALLAAFDLPIRWAVHNSMLVVLARPSVLLGLASLIYLLAAAARLFGPGLLLLAPSLYAPIQVNATLMISRELLTAQRNRSGSVDAPPKEEHS